jgi:hypothetical protein
MILSLTMQKGRNMADLKPTMLVVTSIEAGKGGNGSVMVRFANPYSDTDYYMRVPVKNLNETMQNILKEAAFNVKNFADALGTAANQPLQFSKT